MRAARLAGLLLICFCCLPSIGRGQVPQATDTVLAYRPGFVLEVASWPNLPYSIWTNTTQWLVDSSRVDFSPDRGDVPEVVDVAVLGVTASTEIALPHLSGTETVISWEGSQAPSVVAGALTYVGTGQSSLVVLSDGTSLNFGETSGLTCYDSSGNGNHGTISGATWTTADNSLCAALRDGFSEGFPSYKTDESSFFGTILYPSGEYNGAPVWKNDSASVPWSSGLVMFRNSDDNLWWLTEMSYNGIWHYSSQGTASEPPPVGSIWENYSSAPGGPWGPVAVLASEIQGPFIPADQSDPTKDVLGAALTNPGGSVHNGAECSLVLANGTANTYAQLLALPGATTNANGAITSLYITN